MKEDPESWSLPLSTVYNALKTPFESEYYPVDFTFTSVCIRQFTGKPFSLVPSNEPPFRRVCTCPCCCAAPGPFHWKTLPVLVGPHDNRWDRLSAVMSQRGHFPVIESGERRIECWGKLWHKLVRVLCLRALVNIKHTLVTWLGHDSNPSHPQSKTHFKADLESVSYKIYSLQVQKCFSCLLMVLCHRWDQVQTWVLWWHQRVCQSPVSQDQVTLHV